MGLSDSKIPVGTVLVGKYRVTKEIGRGGMAQVYEAEHLALGKKIAVKVLAAELASSNVVIERFFREARAAARIKSPHIVDVYDSGRLEDGRPFIAMELLEGESLYDRMARIRVLDPKSTVRIVTQCAKGLAKAHAAGIVHRDLKPENIFLLLGEDGEETSKILDFGLAKFYAPVNPDEKAARLTREGAVFGTPAYMSPEQVKGQGSVDHRADLWALGCMAYECLVGRPVWNTDQGVAMTFAAIATAQLPVPSRLRSDLPPEFDRWFHRALERDPAKRFQSAKELADALAQSFDVAWRVTISNPDVTLSESNPDPLEMPPPSIRTDFPVLPAASSRSSTLDLPPTADTPVPSSGPGVGRYILSAIGLTVSVAMAVAVYARVLRPQIGTPVVQSTATIPPPASSSASVDVAQPKPWTLAMYEGQRLFAVGDSAAAQRKLREAAEAGGGAAARTVSEQLKMPSAGPCKMTAFSHPRLGLTANAARPSVAALAKGAIVVWTDDHEQAQRDHAYSVQIDPTGKPLSSPRDLTPEAHAVGRASLEVTDDKLALIYWDKQGRDAGVRVRSIDAEGRIAGRSVLVGGARTGNFWPSLTKGPDGYYAVWQDDRDKEGDDLFVRHLGPELEPVGPELRMTDYAPQKPKSFATVRLPQAAVAANALYITYRLDREQQHLIMRMRLPLTALDKGLEERAAGVRRDREAGDVKLVNEDKSLADAPDIACGKEGCFIVWHGEQGGAHAAMLGPSDGKVVWRKKFSDKGGRPALGLTRSGQVAVAYYEGGRIKVASISRDGVGPSSSLAKISTDQPRPSLSGGPNEGEWYLAWQDQEAGHTEPFVARLSCQ